ncbi:hypothetical protein ACFFWD_33605 [Bradyrhizobium erythrophlei]|uniref:hypothetical protein n=1 Tax=Bradyrhizobium erythrophlei TaxID=1437360 RepID=UPI0035E8ACD5
MANVRDWRIALIEAHPGLFHPPAGYPQKASGYPWCHEGWRDLLERLCVRIEAALYAGETILVVEIKEKFASLRCYWCGDVSRDTAAKIIEAVALAQARSACTCEQCGEPGHLYRHGGIYMTRCTTHANGVEVPPERGRENVHLVRRSLGTSDVYYARYDRESDSFTEVPPPSPGSEE